VKLFVYILNQPEKLEEIMSGFVEIGITGATIVDSVGMGRILSRDVPIFAGFQSLLSGSRPYNKTIISVVDDDEKVERALRLIEELCGSFEDAGAGIAFTLPLDRVHGLKPEIR
jgi:nitrogen regulatory protein P-II 1